MKRTAYSLFIVPGPSGQPRLSAGKMTNAQAAQLGAISIVPGSTTWVEVPDTDAELQRAAVQYPSAGRDGVQNGSQ